MNLCFTQTSPEQLIDVMDDLRKQQRAEGKKDVLSQIGENLINFHLSEIDYLFLPSQSQ